MTKIIDAFKSVFSKHSVDDILASFHKTVSKLEDHAEAKLAASEVYGGWVVKYQAMQVEAHAEVAKARTVANKLRELLY